MYLLIALLNCRISPSLTGIFILLMVMPQIEYKNNTWKQLFSSPQTPAQVYFAEFLNGQLLIILFFIVYNLSMGMSAVAINFIDPSNCMFKKGMNWHQLWVDNVKTFLAVAAVSVIQFVIGLRFKNFIAPIAIGFVMWVIGTVMFLRHPLH